ncbi:hypothetical protein Emed_001343 [Eimeria media]
MGLKAANRSFPLRRRLRAVLVVTAAAVYAQLSLVVHDGGNFGGNHFFPSLLAAEGSLNVHSCVADFMVSSLRDLIYVSYDQLLPEKVVFPVCDSISGPSCPHLRFPPLIQDSAIAGQKASVPDAYAAHLHRPLVWGGAPSGALGGPPYPLVPLDATRTFLHAEPLTAARAQRHRLDQPYVNRGVYLEDGIGDVSAQSLADAISNAIGHLGALTSARGIWAPQGPPPAESFVCFYTRDPRDRRDCHDLRNFSSLPSKYEAEVVSYHSGWRGGSHFLTFDKSRAPFLSPFLERDYSVGLPEADTRWRGRWRVAANEPSSDERGPPSQQQQRSLPVAGPLAEALSAEPSSYKWLLNRKGPPQPIYSYARLDSQEGSFYHSNVFVPYGIWVSASPRVPAASCSPKVREATRKLVLHVQGIQEKESIFIAEVPLYDIVGLHAADSEVPHEYRYVNALDYIKTSPLQRIDMLRFTYAVVGPRGGPAEPLTFDRPLQCSPLHAVLGALHVLVAEKTLSSRVYYSVDATTAEGRAWREKRAAAAKQQQQQEARKEALAARRAPVLQQLLGGTVPAPWKPLKLGTPPLLTASAFDGSETTTQRESANYLGVVVRAQTDTEPQLLEKASLSASQLPVSWQENERIKFGRFDSMANQFADLRKPLKAAAYMLQDLPAEAPVVPLSQLPQNHQVFARKALGGLNVEGCVRVAQPVFESHGRFTSLQVDGGGIGDLRSLITSILKSLGGGKQSKSSSSSGVSPPVAAPPSAAAKQPSLSIAPPPAAAEPAAAAPAPAAAAAPAAAPAAVPADAPAAGAAGAATPAAADEASSEPQVPSVLQQGTKSPFATSLAMLTEALQKASPNFNELIDRMATRVVEEIEENTGAPSEGGPPPGEKGPPSGEQGPHPVASEQQASKPVEQGAPQVLPPAQSKEGKNEGQEKGAPVQEGGPPKGEAHTKEGEAPRKVGDTETTGALRKEGPKPAGAPKKGGPSEGEAHEEKDPLHAQAKGAPERPRKKRPEDNPIRSEAEIQAVLIMGPDGQMLNLGSSSLPLAGGLADLPGALGDIAKTLGVPIDPKAALQQLSAALNSVAQGGAPPFPSPQKQKSGTEGGGPKEDRASEQGPPGTSKDRNSSSSSSSNNSSKDSGSKSNSKSRSAELPLHVLPLGNADVLIERAMQFMSEADPEVVSALMNAAEAHARRVLGRRGGAPDGGAPSSPPNQPGGAPFNLAELLKASPFAGLAGGKLPTEEEEEGR